MAPPAPPPSLPSTLLATLALLLGEYRRRPALLLGLASVPLLLGWLAATLIRASLLSDARWVDGDLVLLPTAEETVRQGLVTILGFIGLPLAYGLVTVVVAGRLLGRPVQVRTALARLLRRPVLLVGWWLLSAPGSLMVVFGIEAPMILLGLAPPVDYAGPVRLLVVTASLFVLPAVLAQWAVLLPVALLEDLYGREAVERSWELGAGERVRHIACLVLAAGLMFLPRLTAEAAYTLTDRPTNAVLWVAAEGLVLGLVAPAAMLAACAPALYALGVGVPRPTPNIQPPSTPAAPQRRPFLTVLPVVVLSAVVGIPFFGTQVYARGLAHVPQLTITPAAERDVLNTDFRGTDGLEPVSGGTVFAALAEAPWRDGPDVLLLHTCEADCPDGQAREQEIGTLPEGAHLSSWAVSADGDRLLAGAVLSTGELAVYRCSDEDCDGPWVTELPSSGLPLYGLRLAPGPHGGYAALLHGPPPPAIRPSDDMPAALLTCSSLDCETPSVSRLPDIMEPDLALAPDGSIAIAHLTQDSSALHLLVCAGDGCDATDSRELDGAWRPEAPRFGGDRPGPSVAIGPDGRPHVAGVGRDGERLLYHACADAHCSS